MLVLRRRAETEVVYLDESVDGKNDQLGLSLGVVHQVEVHQLLLLQAGKGERRTRASASVVNREGRGGDEGDLLVGLHVLEDIREES